MRNISIGGIIYIIIGIVIAANQQYLVDLTSLGRIISALLAIVFWPLVLVGVNLHLVF